MASGTKKKPKNAMKSARKSSVVAKKGTPWGTIIAVVAILALAGGVFGWYYVQSADKREQANREEAAAAWAPSQQNPDPSLKIAGIVTQQYSGSVHVTATERVRYDKTPPFGGPHDGAWAACNGVVYPNPVRTENLVHSLEHGAVWITYNADKVSGDALNKLRVRVQNKPYMVMSPWPGLDSPISLQAWGHQLRVDSVDDERIDQFIAALRLNRNTYPEVGATCDVGPGQFDVDNPPPFDPAPYGPDAKPMDYKGSAGATPPEAGMTQPGAPGGAPVPPGGPQPNPAPPAGG
ncbi:DUF3105 domain-containing protein [Amycolatopsis suaedae]|uniref:DUF3105 domain-containing protein n=1 Tax=Amycolatopsis suaedae TaxID=2510978 RepID=A0A4Q7J2T4_9PSEU|nr:DUF3105 domain-containing protein [Amycolatopsis suaedae]RZQ60876.1 DUF3105 domain-containing protein [Amycolatopsis suaedae]